MTTLLSKRIVNILGVGFDDIRQICYRLEETMCDMSDVLLKCRIPKNDLPLRDQSEKQICF